MDLIEALEYFDEQVDYARAKKCVDAGKSGDSCPQCLKQRYYAGMPVDYSCDQLRLIYALRYLPVHLKENLDILESLAAKGVQNNWGSPVEVLALGGGPGSEIAALHTFVASEGFFGVEVPEIHVTRLDRVKEWDEISKKVRSISKSKKTKFKYFRIDGDVCEVQRFKGAYDLVFFSYIVSELTDAKATELASALKKVLKKTAVLVFNDRNEEAVVSRIALIASQFNCIAEYVSTKMNHVGMSYPDAIKDKVGPKLRLTSYRRGIIVTP